MEIWHEPKDSWQVRKVPTRSNVMLDRTGPCGSLFYQRKLGVGHARVLVDYLLSSRVTIRLDGVIRTNPTDVLAIAITLITTNAINFRENLGRTKRKFTFARTQKLSLININESSIGLFSLPSLSA